ncbi:hypothetical protein VNO77_34294 [Canavalia gladiata]|uniref:Uncharacterized protein n=1 Tax=Canavalia gladiata TaxID=3824 RepID=A0AAN9PX45_CANGL
MYSLHKAYLVPLDWSYGGKISMLKVFVDQFDEFLVLRKGLFKAFALGDFPTPMSLGVITSLFGALMTAIVQFLQGVVSEMCLSFNGWALKKKRLVFVSMFSSIGPVCSIIFLIVTLGETINIGSLTTVAMQYLLLKGINLTLVEIGTAMPNLSPVFIFIIT